MHDLVEIQRLLSDPIDLTAMMAFKRREERARIGSDLFDKPISDFRIFDGLIGNKKLRDKFNSMQDIYIFDDRDKIDFNTTAASLSSIKDSLQSERLT